MLSVMYLVFIRLIKWTLTAALVGVYTEIGIGGEYVGNIVDAFKAVAAEIDWSSLFATIGDELANLSKIFIDKVRDIDVSQVSESVECLGEKCKNSEVK